MELLLNQDLRSRPVVMIGAGGIVNDAHLPAYKIANLFVAAIYDVDVEKAENTAKKFSIPSVCRSFEDIKEMDPAKVVFDIAVPAKNLPGILQELPDNSIVLMQKPMGEDFSQAKKILQITRRKKMVAGVNFQLRYAPFVLKAKEMISGGVIGELCDIEVNVNVYTPWHLWKFLYDASRVEILYHSIHYVDLVRSFLGNPAGVFAKTVKHPLMPELASVRSNIILDYGDMVRANILTNHCHIFGLHNQSSYLKFEGTKGAIKIRMGLNMDYPSGVPDIFEYVTIREGRAPVWSTVPIEGSWFPHAFIGSMAELQKAAADAARLPDNSVEDCIQTMACIEAAYLSGTGGTMLIKNIV